jgi:hypothetical protein
MKYWANEEPRKLIRTIQGQIEEFDHTMHTEIGKVWRRNRRYYYPNLKSEGLEFAGEKEELVKVNSNKFRLRGRQLFAALTRSKLNYRPRAMVQGKNVLGNTQILKGLINHVIEKDKFNRYANRMLEHAIVYGMGYMFPMWRTDRGKIIAADDAGMPVYTGKAQIINPYPWQVKFDTAIDDFNELEELKVELFYNRWDLIAQFPSIAEYIYRLPSAYKSKEGDDRSDMGEDLVRVIAFVHLDTPATKDGRLLIYSDENTIYSDGPNKYDELGIVQFKPEPIDDTPWGYTPLNDVAPLQETLDLALSTAASNLEAYGVGAMLNPQNNNIGLTEMLGRAFITYMPANAEGGGKPEPLQWPQTPAEAWKFHEVVDSEMLQIMNLNPTITGNPPPNVTSNVMVETLQASTIEFLQPWMQPFYESAEIGMERAVSNYRKFAPDGTIIAIAGPNNIAQAREFRAGDLPHVDRISVQQQSPLAATAAGLGALADKLMQRGMIPNVQLLFEFLETGRIESMYESSLAQIEQIRAENDALREGKIVKAWPTDLNPLHVAEHAAIIGDQELRSRADDLADMSSEAQQARAILKNTMNHILEHLELEKTTDPMLRAIIATGHAPEMLPAAQGPAPEDAQGPMLPAEGTPAEPMPAGGV